MKACLDVEAARHGFGRRSLLALGATVAQASDTRAADTTYPSRPVRIIVPFSPGGAIDLAGRTMADALSTALGQSFFVDNRPGAGGLIGFRLVTQAVPDGYTLAVGSGGPLTITPTLFKDSGFDPLRQLTPIILFANTPIVVICRNGIPANTIGELAALSRTHSGGLTVATASAGGSVPQLAGEYLQRRLGVKWLSIPYRGSPAALADLMAERVDVMVDAVPAPAPLVLSGRIKAIGVTTAGRSVQLPDVPTLGEQGFADFDVGSWMSLVGPAGLPPELVARLHGVLAAALRTPEVRDRLSAAGANPEGGEPERITRLLETEIPRWANVLQESGITAGSL